LDEAVHSQKFWGEGEIIGRANGNLMFLKISQKKGVNSETHAKEEKGKKRSTQKKRWGGDADRVLFLEGFRPFRGVGSIKDKDRKGFS